MAEPSSRTPWSVRLAPFLAGVLTFLAFLPALDCGFVDWDDGKNFLLNPHYRGFGWANLRWMFHTTHMGHFQPVSWLSLALDYKIWGMLPFGYHLTNVVLHAANAGLFCVLCMRLLSWRDKRPGWVPAVASLFGALFWALHPLRVESVAWVTERRDMLSGLFFIATLLCFLGWARTMRRPWLAGAVAAYLLSLSSKAIGMTLPVVLLILDVYPLRRLPPDPRAWLRPENRERLWEKLPFLLAAVLFGAFAWLSQELAGTTTALSVFGFWDRAARAGYALFFYLSRTILPWGLSPCYELPLPFNPFAGKSLACSAVVVILGVLVWRCARRAPWAAAAALYFLVTVAPMLGFVSFGNILAADRYAYLPGLGLAVLAAAGLEKILRQASGSFRPAGLVGAAGLCLAWGTLSWRQCRVWTDSPSLWGRVLSLQPATATALHNLGVAAAVRGDYREAVLRLRAARLLWPHAPFINKALAEAHYNQGNAALRRGQLRDAILSYRMSLALSPVLPEAHGNLGLALAGLGRREDACRHYAEAVRLRPDFSAAWYNWGNALADLGVLAQAEARYRRALRLDGGLLDARFNLGNVLARRGFYRDAAAQYRTLLSQAPGFPGARENLSQARRLGGF